MPQAGGTAIQDVRHTWDAVGNLSTRQDVLASETEPFFHDSLDRLTAISGAYTYSVSHDEIGNITNLNGNTYSYGTKPHAVTSVGSTSTPAGKPKLGTRHREAALTPKIFRFAEL
jgi:hypothetical protein